MAEIIGVMGPDMAQSGAGIRTRRSEVAAAVPDRNQRQAQTLEAVARMAPGQSTAGAQAELQ